MRGKKEREKKEIESQKEWNDIERELSDRKSVRERKRKKRGRKSIMTLRGNRVTV